MIVQVICLEAPTSFAKAVLTRNAALHVAVTQERLDDADIGAAFEQMRCKAVTQHMQRDPLGQPSDPPFWRDGTPTGY
jgi:hypothetical protein